MTSSATKFFYSLPVLFALSIVAHPFSAFGQTLALRGETISSSPDNPADHALLVGDRGFSIGYSFGLRDNFIALSNCNGAPGMCVPGASVSFQTVTVPQFAWLATLDGMTFRGGCFDCAASFTYQISGSVVLPPIAPTATVTAPFTMTATFSTGTGVQVPLSGSGTATISLHSPGVVGFPNSWHIDQVELWFDSPLPKPWMSLDIGPVGQAGSASGSVTSDGLGSFTVAGDGSDIWGTTDTFHFALANTTANQITARIDGVENTNPYAKAGITMRGGFSASAPHALLDVKPNAEVEFLQRAGDGGSTAYIGGSAMSAFPVWLRLTEDAYVTAEVSSDGQNWQQVGRVQGSYRLLGLAVTSHDPNVLNHASFSNVSVQSVNGSIGSWQQSDIGSVSVQGTASGSATALTITGEGSDIWGTADAFHYVYQNVSNSVVDLVARVATLTNTSPYAKAGLMFRADLSAGSAQVLLDVKPDGGVEFMARTAAGDTTTFLDGGFQAMPTWLRLHRSGTTFTASVSADGSSWTVVGATDVGSLRVGYVGLAVTSHAPGTAATAEFDSVNLTVVPSLPSGWTAGDIGSTGLVGSAVDDNGTFTVRGAGADIWGTADAFQFAYQSDLTGTLSARVVSETNTNPYAKAGIMLRQDVVPGSPFVMLDMKPDGELEFLYRPASDQPVIYGGGAQTASGAFLRFDQAIAATGDLATITASYSLDGTSWIVLTTLQTRVDMRLAGLAVTSHDTSQLNTAVFDHVIRRCPTCP